VQAGAIVTLLLIGASLLISVLEQLRERKKLLAVLVAFGTRRSTLAQSVLYQTAIPVVLGLVLAMAGGLSLGAMLLAMLSRPVAVDWSGVAAAIGLGAAVVAVVTLLSLPPLWRMMRADGLRTE
jgi:predicted lysophospholipase L1 biosynthesis ABC-type transport system permease subunit